MGWFFLGMVIVLANFYVWYSYRKEASKREFVIIEVIHLILLCLTGVYFLLYFTHQTDHIIAAILSYVASIYVTILLYSCILFLLSDIGCLIVRCCTKKRLFKSNRHYWLHRNFVIFVFCVFFAIYGIWNGTQLTLSSYEVSLPKQGSSLDSLHVVHLSDLHLGGTVKDQEITKIVERVQALSPELIVITGDLFDEASSESQKLRFIEEIKKWKPKYGIYYICGNHEYTSYQLKLNLNRLKDAGVHVLEDETITIDGAFSIVGRKDRLKKRLTATELLEKVDSSLPVFVLDHRPYYQDLLQVDHEVLQLSGHTHNGQIFPFQPFYRLIGECAYGFCQSKNVQLIVTSGAGTGGVPMRIGSTREIVDVKITFR